jgi:RimJ/RimL family protein N-acetyltransferase
MEKIILKTKRLNLRPVKLADAVSFFKWIKDKEVIKYLNPTLVKSIEDEKKFISKNNKNKEKYFFAIENENKKLIGNTEITLNKKNNTVVFGIVIGEKDEWDKGYGTEVLKLLADFVFFKLKFNRFELEVALENKRAIKVYKRIGFKKEGIKRESSICPITKKYKDSMIMSILKSEYKK